MIVLFSIFQIVEELAYILSHTSDLTNRTSMSDALENPFMLEAASGNHVSDLARYMLTVVAARVDRYGKFGLFGTQNVN